MAMCSLTAARSLALVRTGTRLPISWFRSALSFSSGFSWGSNWASKTAQFARCALLRRFATTLHNTTSAPQVTLRIQPNPINAGAGCDEKFIPMQSAERQVSNFLWHPDPA